MSGEDDVGSRRAEGEPVLGGGFRTRGVIEGFYGEPFRWQDREALIRFIGARGMNTYVYAPKNDPFHREQWREPYGESDRTALARLAEVGRLNGVRLIYAIAPGLTYDAANAAEFGRLSAKLDQVLTTGVEGIALLFDDLAPDSAAIEPDVQADLVARTAARVEQIAPGAEFWFIGNYYAGTADELAAGRGVFSSLYRAPARAYFDAYAERVPPSIPIGWTGPGVFSAVLSRADAVAFRAMVRRPVLLWDNFPVNDAMPASLFLGPYVGRDPDLAGALDGVVANLMSQASACRIPLATVADYLRDPERYDPNRSHAAAIAEVGGAAASPLGLFVDHHRGHPVLAAEAEALELGRLVALAFGDRGDEKVRRELGTFLEAIAACEPGLAADLPDRDLWREIEPFCAKLAELARAGSAGLDALAGRRPIAEFRALRDAAERRFPRVACTALSDGLRPFTAGAGAPVDRFAELFAAIEDALERDASG